MKSQLASIIGFVMTVGTGGSFNTYTASTPTTNEDEGSAPTEEEVVAQVKPVCSLSMILYETDGVSDAQAFEEFLQRGEAVKTYNAGLPKNSPKRESFSVSVNPNSWNTHPTRQVTIYHAKYVSGVKSTRFHTILFDVGSARPESPVDPRDPFADLPFTFYLSVQMGILEAHFTNTDSSETAYMSIPFSIAHVQKKNYAERQIRLALNTGAILRDSKGRSLGKSQAFMDCFFQPIDS